MIRTTWMLALLVACVTSAEPVGTPPTSTEPTFEPIGLGAIREGIQIGEGGDAAPCGDVLTPSGDVVDVPAGLGEASAFLASLDRAFVGLGYAIEGATGPIDVLQYPEPEAYLLTQQPLPTALPGDCERAAWVAGVWVRLDADTFQVDVPAVAASNNTSWAWAGEAPALAFGLPEEPTVVYVRGSLDARSNFAGTLEYFDNELIGAIGK